MTATPQHSYLSSLKSLLDAPAIKQLVFLLGIAGGVTLGIFLYSSIQEPSMRPLDYQINQQNMSAIVDTLEKSGIQYKINDQEGIVYVPAKDYQLAKLKLSGAGVAKDDSFNFAYLNDQSSIGNSQFLESARFIRALESDLSKTISGIEGISAARVHIAVPQNNVFADENQRPTASVVISMAPGLSNDKEKVRAIVQIIASSVPGLDPKDVAITDQYGHFLSGSADQSLAFNADQLNYQNSLQNYYEKRIESMVSPLMGNNKVNVRVFANLDFTQQEEAQEQYDPDHKVVRSEQTVDEHNSSGSGASGAPGALSNSPPDGDTGAAAAGAGNSDGKTESVKNYEVSKSVMYKKASHPKIMSLSVAVVIDNEMTMDATTHKLESKPVTPDKINQITDLIKATIGFDEKRGDKVTVINSSFSNTATTDLVAAPAMWMQPWFWDLIKKTIGMCLGFGFLFLMYKRINSYLKQVSRPQRLAVTAIDNEEEKLVIKQIQDLKQEKMTKLKDIAGKDPDRVALIIKNWVGK